MVRKADVIARIVPPPSKTGQDRHDGAQSEIRKGIRSSKPIIELYERGARDSPNRSLSEKNYGKRVPIHLKPNEIVDMTSYDEKLVMDIIKVFQKDGRIKLEITTGRWILSGD